MYCLLLIICLWALEVCLLHMINYYYKITSIISSSIILLLGARKKRSGSLRRSVNFSGPSLISLERNGIFYMRSLLGWLGLGWLEIP